MTFFNATNPEEDLTGCHGNRIKRLNLVLEYMNHKYGYHRMKDRIIEMYDHKGNLYVHWESKASGNKHFQVYIEQAWALVGLENEDQVYHSFENVHGQVRGSSLLHLHHSY